MSLGAGSGSFDVEVSEKSVVEYTGSGGRLGFGYDYLMSRNFGLSVAAYYYQANLTDEKQLVSVPSNLTSNAYSTVIGLYWNVDSKE